MGGFGTEERMGIPVPGVGLEQESFIRCLLIYWTPAVAGVVCYKEGCLLDSWIRRNDGRGEVQENTPFTIKIDGTSASQVSCLACLFCGLQFLFRMSALIPEFPRRSQSPEMSQQIT